VSAAQEKGARRDGWAGAKRKDGPEEGEVWAGLGCGKEGRERKKKAWAGPKGKREKEMGFAFSFVKDPNKFNSNLNSKELKLELNNKQ